MRIASLISGGGTTMEQVGLACKSGEVDGELSLVIASSDAAGGRGKADKLGVPAIITVNPKLILEDDIVRRRRIFGEQLLEALHEHRIDIVLQNGWMPRTPVIVIEEFEGRIFNQHPGPPEDFGGKGMFGKRVHAAVLHYRKKMHEEGLILDDDLWTEVIAQRVHVNYDEGLVVESQRVPLFLTDSVSDLQGRSLPEEHLVQIRLLQNILHGDLKEQKKQCLATTERARQILEEAKRIGITDYPEG